MVTEAGRQLRQELLRMRAYTDLLEWLKVERTRQKRQWGYAHDDTHSDLEWLAIVQKELGELADGCLSEYNASLEAGMIKVAAVLLSWAETRRALQEEALWQVEEK